MNAQQKSPDSCEIQVKKTGITTSSRYALAGIQVGTLLCSTGRRIHLKDLYDTPEEEQQLQTAWEAAVARGNFWYSQKKYNPGIQLNKLDNPFMTDNFFIKGKEIHFIYQKGEVAANCFAAVEVVIPCWAGGIMGR